MIKLKNKHSLVKLGGLNNNNYLTDYYNNKYVLRIPNKNNINFNNENKIIFLANIYSITPEIIYHNKENGILLSLYLENSNITELTPNDNNFMMQFSKTLKELHKLKCDNIFNPFEDIKNKINELKEKKYNFCVDIESIIVKLESIEAKVSENITLGLCHNDLNVSNVLYFKGEVYFIDFEYSAMGDIFFDLATFSWLLNDYQRKCLLKNYFGYINKDIEEQLEKYLFVVKLWNALWSIEKSYFNNKLEYDYEEGANIILKRLSNKNG